MALVASACIALDAVPAAAQRYVGLCAPGYPCKDPPPQPNPQAGAWFGAAGLNIALGGVTAAAFAAVRGKPVLPALAGGAAGGAVAFTGRAVSGRGWSGAGFVGREVSAVGASMIANASHGSGLLSSLSLPVGPITLHIQRDSGTSSVHASVDVLATAFTAYAVASRDYRFDLRATLAAGAPVFNAPEVAEDRYWRGGMVAGVILMRYGRDYDGWRQVLAHEQVHVAQHDLSARVWGEPLESALLGLLPRGQAMARHLDFGLDFVVWAGVHVMLNNHQSAPWEREARLLAGQTH